MFGSYNNPGNVQIHVAIGQDSSSHLDVPTNGHHHGNKLVYHIVLFL